MTIILSLTGRKSYAVLCRIHLRFMLSNLGFVQQTSAPGLGTTSRYWTSITTSAIAGPTPLATKSNDHHATEVWHTRREHLFCVTHTVEWPAWRLYRASVILPRLVPSGKTWKLGGMALPSNEADQSGAKIYCPGLASTFSFLVRNGEPPFLWIGVQIRLNPYRDLHSRWLPSRDQGARDGGIIILEKC